MNNNEIKVGDKVTIKPSVAKTLRGLPNKNGLFEIVSVVNGFATAELAGKYVYLPSDYYELVKPTDEIKVGGRVNTPYGLLIVDMIAGCIIFGHYENGDAGIWTKEGLSKHKPADHNDNTITIPVKADLDDTYWDAYKAELASKIAVAYAEKGRFAPDEIGEFAVRVADDVVDNLKKQSDAE